MGKRGARSLQAVVRLGEEVGEVNFLDYGGCACTKYISHGSLIVSHINVQESKTHNTYQRYFCSFVDVEVPNNRNRYRGKEEVCKDVDC